MKPLHTLPPGDERRGTKPDRFDAVVKNPYWLNVTRFFAGCFSKGELPSLVDRLHELTEKDGFRHTNYPRRVAATLLADWVFSQDQRSTREAVELVLDGVGLRHPYARKRHVTPGAFTEDSLVLPQGCGREQLVERCFELLAKKPPEDYATEIAQLLKANAALDEIAPRWYSQLKQAIGSGSELTHWLRSGMYLGTLPACSIPKLDKALEGKALNANCLSIILNSGRSDFIEANEDRARTLIDGLLDGSVVTFRRNPDLVSRFAVSVEPYWYGHAFENQAPIPLRTVLIRYNEMWDSDEKLRTTNTAATNETLQKCAEVVMVAEQEINRTAAEWATDLVGWDNVVEKSRALWGERLKHFLIANLAAGIRSEDVTCKEYADLLDHAQPLCRRVRHARLKASAHRWWQSQIENASNKLDKALVSLVFMSWASISTKLKLLGVVEEMLDSLPATEWRLVSEGITDQRSNARIRPSGDLEVGSLPRKLSARMVVALGAHLRRGDTTELFSAYLADYDGDDDSILKFCVLSALTRARREPDKWDDALRYIEKRYAKGKTSQYLRYVRVDRLTESLPFHVADHLAQNPNKYPRNLVYIAEERIQLETLTNLEPVGNTAAREGWFERDTRQRRKR